jgi:hypothetical protein
MTSLEFPFKWILQQEMDGKRYSDVLVPQAISQL